MATRIPSLISISLLAFGLVGGCSLVIDVDEVKQCSTNADCQALGPAFAGATCEKNLCVAAQTDDGSGGAAGGGNEPSDPLMCEVMEPSTEPTVKYTFAPVFADGGEPEEKAPFSIKACKPADLTCANPVFGPIDVNPGEPQDFLVPPGFAGYFEIIHPGTLGGYLFMGRPIVQDTVGWNVTMPTPDLVAAFSLATGELVDQEKGLIIAVARDCAQLPLPGVAMSNSKGGLQFYFVKNTPDTSLKESGPQGAVGFANVQVSTTTLEGIDNASGHKFLPAIVRVKPHYVSLVELFP